MKLSRSALIPATSPTSIDLFVVRAARPHDPTAVEEVRASRPHHNPHSIALAFVGQASRLPGGWVASVPAPGPDGAHGRHVCRPCGATGEFSSRWHAYIARRGTHRYHHHGRHPVVP
jgi:hypothetical protein